MISGCFFQAEDGIRDRVRSRGRGDVYKRQLPGGVDYRGAGGAATWPVGQVTQVVPCDTDRRFTSARTLLPPRPRCPRARGSARILAAFPRRLSPRPRPRRAWWLSLIHISEPTRPY